MIRAILLLCVFSRANLEMQTFQHQTYISRKSRSNSSPTHSGYVYSRIGNGPGMLTTFNNSYVKPTEKYTTVATDEYAQKIVPIKSQLQDKTADGVHTNGIMFKKPLSLTKNEEQVKAGTKYKPTKQETSHTHLEPHETDGNIIKDVIATSTVDKEFRTDNEDVRTDSINTFNVWPYSYRLPIEYNTKHVDITEKAKDKRYLGADTSIIPVHENPDDIPSAHMRRLTNVEYYKETTTDNPIYGNQPFFSFVLNDYFEKSNEEDPLIFKDFSWGHDFDHGLPYQDIDDNGRSSRHLNYKYPKHLDNDKYFGQQYNTKSNDLETVTKKAFDSKIGYDKHENRNEKGNQQASEHGYKGNRQSGFKNFLDSFANKFGSENLNKNSKFMLKQDQDKGEKKKGFRRVYHKDEYQEDNEFYDNTNNKAVAEENGGSNFNMGGSKAILQSHAAASLGNEANSLTKIEGEHNNRFEKGDKGHERHKGYEDEIKRYQNIAQNAALSNNADYIDQYET